MKEFYPFEKAYETASDIENILELLDLSKARLALLWQLLRRFEIDIWFHADKDAENPRVEVVTFWDMNHVASIPLIELLENLVRKEDQTWFHLGREEEIVALTEVKNVIERAIVSRQQQNDAALPTADDVRGILRP